MALIKVLFSLVPVFLFLAVLIFFDSYKLVRPGDILRSIFIGGVVCLVCFVITTAVLRLFDLELRLYSRYVAPILEESFKAVYIIYLMRKKKIGFIVDGAIYGFTIGAGFAVVENMDYLIHLQEYNLFFWIIRGFGTAVMHGSTTAILAILVKGLASRHDSEKIRHVLAGLCVAIVIHAIYNHFIFDPRMTTVVQLLVFPVLTFLIFSFSEKSLQDWLEMGMDTDVNLLEYITTGTISETKVGKYLLSLKDRFPGEVVADMLCMLRLYLELAIRAKGILMMRKNGFSPSVDPEIREKLAELKYLEKNIGKTGKLAMSPILNTSTRDLWQIYLLEP